MQLLKGKMMTSFEKGFTPDKPAEAKPPESMTNHKIKGSIIRAREALDKLMTAWIRGVAQDNEYRNAGKALADLDKMKVAFN